jgi:N-acetylneuraminic acid mutarotase
MRVLIGCIFSLLFLIQCKEESPVTDTWKSISDFPGDGFINSFDAQGTGFSINGKAYIGGWGKRLQVNGIVPANDFWEYDPTSNAWTPRAAFPGETRVDAIAFSIGTKGYIGLGYGSGGTHLKDFWEYDPANNSWTRKEDFGGAARRYAAAFAIGQKGYVGTGRTLSEIALSSLNDFWEYDQNTGRWTRKADYPGGYTENAFSVSIGSKGYMGGGIVYADDSSPSKFYEYDPGSNQWMRKADFPLKVSGQTAFTANSKAFLIAAENRNNRIYEYDPTINQWTPREVLPFDLFYGVVFSIDNDGYMGLSVEDVSIERDGVSNKFYQYKPK